jgi:hypothetical protein
MHHGFDERCARCQKGDNIRRDCQSVPRGGIRIPRIPVVSAIFPLKPLIPSARLLWSHTFVKGGSDSRVLAAAEGAFSCGIFVKTSYT